MHHKSRCKIVVYSSKGRTYTTRRGARRLLHRGLAVLGPDGTLRMVEGDHRFAHQADSTRPPRLKIISGHAGWGYPHGFAHFPLVIQTSSGQLRRTA